MNKLKTRVFCGLSTEIIKTINDKPEYVLGICRKINSAYCYTSHLIQDLIDNGFLESKKRGNRKELRLTEKGRKVKALLIELERLGFE